MRSGRIQLAPCWDILDGGKQARARRDADGRPAHARAANARAFYRGVELGLHATRAIVDARYADLLQAGGGAPLAPDGVRALPSP